MEGPEFHDPNIISNIHAEYKGKIVEFVSQMKSKMQGVRNVLLQLKDFQLCELVIAAFEEEANECQAIKTTILAEMTRVVQTHQEQMPAVTPSPAMSPLLSPPPPGLGGVSPVPPSGQSRILSRPNSMNKPILLDQIPQQLKVDETQPHNDLEDLMPSKLTEASPKTRTKVEFKLPSQGKSNMWSTGPPKIVPDSPTRLRKRGFIVASPQENRPMFVDKPPPKTPLERKLSSPRRKKTPQDAARVGTEKRRLAQSTRQEHEKKLQETLRTKHAEVAQKAATANAEKKQKADKIEKESDEKQMKAGEVRQKNLKEIAKKAHKETERLKEIESTKSKETETKRLETDKKIGDAENRRATARNETVKKVHQVNEHVAEVSKRTKDETLKKREESKARLEERLRDTDARRQQQLNIKKRTASKSADAGRQQLAQKRREELEQDRLNKLEASARKQDRAQRQRDKLLEQRAHTAASLQPVKPAPKEPLSPDQREKKVIVVPTPVSAWRSHFDSKQCRLYGRRMLDLSREYEASQTNLPTPTPRKKNKDEVNRIINDLKKRSEGPPGRVVAGDGALGLLKDLHKRVQGKQKESVIKTLRTSDGLVVLGKWSRSLIGLDHQQKRAQAITIILKILVVVCGSDKEGTKAFMMSNTIHPLSELLCWSLDSESGYNADIISLIIRLLLPVIQIKKSTLVSAPTSFSDTCSVSSRTSVASFEQGEPLTGTENDMFDVIMKFFVHSIWKQLLKFNQRISESESIEDKELRILELMNNHFIIPLVSIHILENKPVYVTRPNEGASEVIKVLHETGLLHLPALMLSLFLQELPKATIPNIVMDPSSFDGIMKKTVLISVLKSCVIALNAMARLGLSLIQSSIYNCLNSNEVFYWLQLVLSFNSIQLKSPECPPAVEKMAMETIVMVGYFVLGNRSNQTVLQWGSSVELTPMLRLVDLPLRFFADNEFTEKLFPTVILAAVDHDKNTFILKQDMGIDQLVDFLNDKEKQYRGVQDPSVPVNYRFCNRVPKSIWKAAVEFFGEAQKDDWVFEDTPPASKTTAPSPTTEMMKPMQVVQLDTKSGTPASTPKNSDKSIDSPLPTESKVSKSMPKPPRSSPAPPNLPVGTSTNTSSLPPSSPTRKSRYTTQHFSPKREQRTATKRVLFSSGSTPTFRDRSASSASTGSSKGPIIDTSSSRVGTSRNSIGNPNNNKTGRNFSPPSATRIPPRDSMATATAATIITASPMKNTSNISISPSRSTPNNGTKRRGSRSMQANSSKDSSTKSPSVATPTSEMKSSKTPTRVVNNETSSSDRKRKPLNSKRTPL
eukprot:TRINITY_DN48215_c0_g1_i7.p1 TRINITY_DN48215_c0_g1~~TRINITY_DN48215_c0_g1_i7.p1  ORF type:complete len:1309 (-),score=436.48 TRINITY_DN48215_c0_g1_i7:427-4353(-)